MSIMPDSNSSYTIKSGDSIFIEGQKANSINIIAKGKVDIYISSSIESQSIDEKKLTNSSYRLFSINQNIFIGANDLFLSENHTLSYCASSDSTIFSYCVNSINEIEALFMEKPEYPAYVINSIFSIAENAYNSLKKLEYLIQSLSITADNLCLFFWILKDKHGFSYEPKHSAFRDAMFRFKEIKAKKEVIPYFFDAEFCESCNFEYDYFPSQEIDALKMSYYKKLCSINADLKKQFLNQSFIISQYNCTDCSLLLESILFKIKEAFKVAEEYIEILYSKQEPCIFNEFLEAGAEIEKSQFDPTDIIEIQQYMVNNIKNVIDIMKIEYNHTIEIDISEVEKKCNALVNDIKDKVKISSISNNSYADKEGIPQELNNSAEKILKYSNISKEHYDSFMNLLNAFRRLKDKSSDDEQVKNLRKDMTTIFFEIYEAVVKRVAVEGSNDKLINMFLTYSYMDEKLLSPKNLWTLYDISEIDVNSEQTSVFSIKNWLQLIYNKDKNPSIDSFSLDYFDTFRELKKFGKVREEDKIKYDNDQDGRLSFEINSMFKPNHRLCNKQISTYFPILYDGVIVKDLDKALVTPKKINDAIQKVLSIDFSAFHRELSYFNMKKGIEKEYIVQAVRPDIILMPAYGTVATMWQELSGRVRNSPGRFIIPIFTDGNIDDMMQKLIGDFRWELCKTMMGLAWNDITIKSITSEYVDYIQFFKKNRDISEEGKEKIKQQVKKYRNVARDIFTSDYISWLNYESNGAIRLNKLARDIFYKYCPFSKAIRQKLSIHPSFATAANQFEILRAKQVKDLENRYARYAREGIALDEEMIETLNFYKNF